MLIISSAYQIFYSPPFSQCESFCSRFLMLFLYPKHQSIKYRYKQQGNYGRE